MLGRSVIFTALLAILAVDANEVRRRISFHHKSIFFYVEIDADPLHQVQLAQPGRGVVFGLDRGGQSHQHRQRLVQSAARVDAVRNGGARMPQDIAGKIE